MTPEPTTTTTTSTDPVADTQKAVSSTASSAINTVTKPLAKALQPVSTLMRLFTSSAPSFRFVVAINGAPYGVFTECDLPSIEWDTTPLKEGGLNTHVHQLIGQRKAATITLKNGVGSGLLVAWYIATMNGVFDIPVLGLRRTITVTLLNSWKLPVMAWHINDAFPMKWSGPQLKTSENSVAIQTLQFACGEVIMIPGIGT